MYFKLSQQSQRHPSCLRAVVWMLLGAISAIGLVATGPSLWAADAQPVALVNPAALPAQPEEIPQPLPGTTGLTLQDLETMALSGNPALGRGMAAVGAARGNWVQVGLKPNPSVGYEGQQIGSGGLAEQHGVAFGQEIVTGGKLRLNREVASGDIAVAEQQVGALRMRVLTDVRIAYFQVLVAQRQIDLAEQMIRVSAEGSKIADSLLKAKQVGRVDVLQAKLESDQAALLMRGAKNRYDSAWRELAAVIGNPSLPSQTVSGDPTAAPCNIQYDDVLARLLSQSPEVATAVAQLERARAALGRARAQAVPNVSVQGLVNWQDNGIGGKPDGAVGVSVPLQVFDRNQGGIARADREVVAAQHAIDQIELDLQQRLAPVFERFTNASQQAMTYRESILPTAEESLRLTRQGYEAGEANYIGLLTAQRTYAYASRDYLDSVLKLRIAESELNGLLLSGSLQDRGQAAPIAIK